MPCYIFSISSILAGSLYTLFKGPAETSNPPIVETHERSGPDMNEGYIDHERDDLGRLESYNGETLRITQRTSNQLLT